MIFLATQFSFFVGRPVYKDLGLKLTDESLDSLKKLEKVPAETLKSLEPIREKLMQEEKYLDEIRNAIGEENLKKFKDVILEKSIRIKKLTPNEPIEIASYLLLTFGSFLFMITGLYLPQIIKLKVGALEIEKSSVDQIKSIETLGISK